MPSKAMMSLIPTQVPAKQPVNGSARQVKTKRVRAVPVGASFVGLPVQLAQLGVEGLDKAAPVQQWIYLRRKQDVSADDEAGGGEEEAGRTVFAVNLPRESTAEDIKEGFVRLVRARLDASTGNGSAVGNSKGKGRDETNSSGDGALVESVELVKLDRSAEVKNTVLGREGITLSSSLLKAKQAKEDAAQGAARDSKKNKKKRKAQDLEESQPEQAPDAGPSVHPLYIAQDSNEEEAIDTDTALDHLFPSTSTIKAHILLTSPKLVSILLGIAQSWPVTSWPSASEDEQDIAESSFISLGAVSSASSTAKQTKRPRSRDEILYDLSRPSLASLKLHVDDWMKHFDAKQTSTKAAAKASSAAEEAAPKSKRALAREAAAKARALAELEANKAIKKRRLYDDDYAAPEADADGWITVARGGKYGRSGEAAAGEEQAVEDEEEVRKAMLEGYASGKRSIGVARKGFGKAYLEEEDREVAVKKLYAALGLGDGMPVFGSATAAGSGANGADASTTSGEMVDDSRGSGRGKKKKKSRGIETNMYGFQKRQDSKKSLSDLRTRFEEDKRRIEEMKKNKMFRPY